MVKYLDSFNSVTGGFFMGTQFRDDLIALIEENRKTYTDMSDTIWGYAEPRFQEYKSSELHC